MSNPAPGNVSSTVSDRPGTNPAVVSRCDQFVAEALVGTNTERIVEAVRDLLDDPEANAVMSRVVNPYGDGHAAERVLAAIVQRSSP